MKNCLRGALMAACLLPLLSACSTWTKTRCTQTDWYGLGKQYGESGAHFDIDEAANRCQQYQIKVNRATYHQGYIAGLRIFCSDASALHYGEQGQHYLGQCRELSFSRDQQYRRFWKRGLISYCVPSVIRQLALEGKPFPTWCPEERHAVLNVAYDKGVAVKRQRLSMHSHIDYLNKRIKHINKEITALLLEGVAREDHRIQQLESERSHLTHERYLVEERYAASV